MVLSKQECYENNTAFRKENSILMWGRGKTGKNQLTQAFTK